mgnify:CR=1 FL=1
MERLKEGKTQRQALIEKVEAETVSRALAEESLSSAQKQVNSLQATAQTLEEQLQSAQEEVERAQQQLREDAANEKRMRRVLQRVKARWTHTTTFKTFATWASNVYEIKHQRVVLERFHKRWSNLAASRAFLFGGRIHHHLPGR